MSVLSSVLKWFLGAQHTGRLDRLRSWLARCAPARCRTRRRGYMDSFRRQIKIPVWLQAGFEHNPALIGLPAPILIAGPGRFALGRFLPLPRSAPTGRPIIVLE